MGRKRGSPAGSVVYYLYLYIYIDATCWQPEKPPLHGKLGPFSSLEDAKRKQDDEEEARGEPGYEYTYRIEAESWPRLPSA